MDDMDDQGSFILEGWAGKKKRFPGILGRALGVNGGERVPDIFILESWKALFISSWTEELGATGDGELKCGVVNTSDFTEV